MFFNGGGEKVIVSLISLGFFLIEFPSERFCEWVLDHTWHVHHAAMVLRRWKSSIQPLDLLEKLVLIWISVLNVPP
ncbi:hypothetical protein LINPERHAP2_LOCUS28697 [Linum perenne]